MTDAIVWKHATERDLELLADRHTLDECKRDLAAILKLDPADEKKAFLLSFHVHNYSYPPHIRIASVKPVLETQLSSLTVAACIQQSFTLRQTSVLLGMCQTLMEKDLTATSTSDLNGSFAFFQSLLLTHSVERSPKSVGIFSPLEVAAVVDFVTHTYFRHFHLYKAIFTPFEHAFAVQRTVNGVQGPRAPRPLAEGILHIEPPVAIESHSFNDTEADGNDENEQVSSGL